VIYAGIGVDQTWPLDLAAAIWASDGALVDAGLPGLVAVDGWLSAEVV
jgi:hypothetical protein